MSNRDPYSDSAHRSAAGRVILSNRRTIIGEQTANYNRNLVATLVLFSHLPLCFRRLVHLPL